MANFTTEDVEYLRHGDRKIMARVFKPEGAGPFPCFIDLHGGAWNNGDLNDRTGLGEYLAAHGVVMPTLNFRHAADGYPSSLADINYGIRWAKAHAKELKIDPNKVFIGGASSGGHLAMLVAMRPNDRATRRSRARAAMTQACRASTCYGLSSTRCRAIATRSAARPSRIRRPSAWV